MKDKELLGRAAKAAGIGAEYVEWDDVDNGACATFMVPNSGGWGKNVWNPLTDDGDALRLAVKLSLTVDIGIDKYTECQWLNSDVEIQERFNGNPYAATRRAIVRAAAEIGGQP